MNIGAIAAFLEETAHSALQESYDNVGLLTGSAGWDCKGILCSLDITEEVVQEAITKKCNLVVAHHPIIFRGLKRINGTNYTEKAVITAIKNDIALYAIHTNLDNVINGVNGKIASLLGLTKSSVLLPRDNSLKKLFTFVPLDKAEKLRQAIFDAGGGQIGNYSECSFNVEGTGTFKAGEGSDPYAGKVGKRHMEPEVKIEVIFPSFLEQRIIKAMKAVHPYEEVAYDIVTLSNSHPGIGAGIIGELPGPMNEMDFLKKIKEIFKLTMIRHTALLNRPLQRLAICGGAGSFLISRALALGADAYITADIKYHEFFDANGRMLICDIGHYESEQFTIDLLREILEQKFTTFAVLKTEVRTNPVYYF